MGDLFAPLDDHPAYRQIANVIEQRIVGRSLRTGDPLPSEMDLARQFGVNHHPRSDPRARDPRPVGPGPRRETAAGHPSGAAARQAPA